MWDSMRNFKPVLLSLALFCALAAPLFGQDRPCGKTPVLKKTPVLAKAPPQARWGKNLQEGQALAKATSRPLLVYAYDTT